MVEYCPEWIIIGTTSSKNYPAHIGRVTDIEFIVIRILAAILGLALGWLAMKNVLGGLFFAILFILLPPVILDRAIINRQNKFHNQLLDVLILIKGAVQAGYSLLQSLDLALKEMQAPASEEFGRVLKEVRFGFPIEQALTNLAERMENDDLQIVVTAIIINLRLEAIFLQFWMPLLIRSAVECS